MIDVRLNINHVSKVKLSFERNGKMKKYTIEIEEAVVVKRIYEVEAASEKEALEKFDKAEEIVLVDNEEEDTLPTLYGHTPEPRIVDEEDLEG